MKYKTLVLSGGGTRGILHLGAINYLEENNLTNFDTFIGTSVGSFIASLLAVGYKSSEIFDFILYFDTKTLKNFNLSNIITNYGLDNGDMIMFVFNKLIEKKTNIKNITFKELYNTFNKKLIVCATCLNESKSYYFSYDSHPDMQINLAVRMSIAIPFIFTSVLYNGLLFTDGGLMDNYPIEQTKNMNNTIGIYIDSNKNYCKIDNLEEFTLSVLNCLFISNIDYNKKYNKNTIYIPADNLSSINFSMSELDKQKLFNLGYDYSKKFINNQNILIDDDINDKEDLEEIQKYINDNNSNNDLENDLENDSNNDLENDLENNSNNDSNNDLENDSNNDLENDSNNDSNNDLENDSNNDSNNDLESLLINSDNDE